MSWAFCKRVLAPPVLYRVARSTTSWPLYMTTKRCLCCFVFGAFPGCRLHLLYECRISTEVLGWRKDESLLVSTNGARQRTASYLCRYYYLQYFPSFCVAWNEAARECVQFAVPSAVVIDADTLSVQHDRRTLYCRSPFVINHRT